MYKTVFESDLSEFFFGETCSENEQMVVYARYGEGVTTNLPENPGVISGKVRWLSLGAAVTAIFFATVVQTNMFTVMSRQKREPMRAEATHAPPGVGDGRAIVDRLARARDYFALSQQELADLLGLSLSTITKLEASRHVPSASSVQKIARSLELFDYLKASLGDRKYSIRVLFHSASPTFGGMNAIEFAKDIGDDGLDEVYAVFKRQYG